MRADRTLRRAQARALMACLTLACMLPGGAMAEIAALAQPAIMSHKAPRSLMLGVAAAGKRLVAVGERGIVLLSDDEGKSWRQAHVPVSSTLTAVHFADARHGWAVGHLGVVLHTCDGGERWVKQLDGIALARLALDEAARLPGASEAQRRYAQRLVADGPDKPFLDVAFVDTLNGYVAGAGNLLFRTRDGGKSWLPWMFRAHNPDSLNIYGIHAAGDTVVLAGERGLLLRSRDGGASFQPLASPYKGSYFGVLGAGGGAMLLYGLRGNAFWSDDGGDSWRKADTGLDTGLAAATRLADGAVVLASQGGELIASRDRGQSFIRLQAGMQPVSAVAATAGGALMTVGMRGVRDKALAALTGSKK